MHLVTLFGCVCETGQFTLLGNTVGRSIKGNFQACWDKNLLKSYGETSINVLAFIFVRA